MSTTTTAGATTPNGAGTINEPSRTKSEKVAEAAHARVDQAAEHAAAFEKKAKAKARDAADKFSEKNEEMQIKAKEAGEQARVAIQENPLMAAGVAFAVGFVLSSILRR